MEIKPAGFEGMPWITERNFGTGTVLANEGGRTVLTPGGGDKVHIFQVKESLQLLVNNWEKWLLTPAESRAFEVRGAGANVTVDPGVGIPIGGLVWTGEQPLVDRGAQPKETSLAGDLLKAELIQKLPAGAGAFPTMLESVHNDLQRFAAMLGAEHTPAAPPRSHAGLLPLLEAVVKLLEPILAKLPPTGSTRDAAGLTEPWQGEQPIRITPGLPMPPHSGGQAIPGPIMYGQAREPLADLMRGVIQTAANLGRRIAAGGTPDLSPLGSQVTEAMGRLRSGEGQKADGTFAGMKIVQGKKGEVGDIPLDQRQIPPGMEPKEARKISAKINDALCHDDTGKIRDLAKDPKAMALATPEEKAVLIKDLAGQSNLKGKNQESNREAINKILHSIDSPQQYQAVMERAGVAAVQKAMTADVKKPEDQKRVTDFNVTTGAMGHPEFATDLKEAVLAVDAMKQGYSSQEVLAAREKATHANDSGKVRDLAEDPLAMMLTIPQEKSGMVSKLSAFPPSWTSTRDQRAMVSIMESCQDQAEFDAVMNSPGWGKLSTGNIAHEAINEKEAKGKFNMLCGAYDRVGWANDPKQAEKARGALTDPARMQQLLGGADARTVQPAAVDTRIGRCPPLTAVTR